MEQPGRLSSQATWCQVQCLASERLLLDNRAVSSIINTSSGCGWCGVARCSTGWLGYLNEFHFCRNLPDRWLRWRPLMAVNWGLTRPRNCGTGPAESAYRGLRFERGAPQMYRSLPVATSFPATCG